ncbi:YihY/virulence factor BrkB family protein [Nostocoides sp. HKS02]|uniref:YihY/virulence factor BrkB family protein n=1 Tax=Nostocoides sp. HKS02 TaxID=1813880 RepID=UPI0012B4CC0C|nr:YihY/virulence factor BrkB family protein [Tetrasphaera sp. HKS02]QGN56592.1 YihY/virulence factor BrkB family protein [Tetrasphaera sp. HKS02]
MQTLKRWWARVQQTPAGRAWKRYGDTRGSLLAAGVTYFGFLSIFPILALAFAVFGFLLRGHPQWLGDIRHYLDGALPGFVQDPQGKNGLIPLTLPRGGTLATVGIVGVAGLLWGGLGWLDALREGVRAVFGVTGSAGNVVTDKLRDIGVLVVIGLAVIISAVVAALANGATGFVAELVGLGRQQWLVTAVGVVVQALLNTAVVGLVLRVLTGVPVPWKGLRNGAIFGGVGLTVLQLFGTRLIAGTLHNPVFASIGLVVGLLVFLNFISRVLLVAAAWAANDLATATATATAQGGQDAGQRLKATEGPEQRPLVGLKGRTDAGLPTFSQRAADRTSVAAGAVLGALGAVVVGSGARGIRSLVRRR